MIKIDKLIINNVNDYNKLEDLIDKDYYHTYPIEQIKNRIGTKCCLIMIEYPYYDLDYLSTYYSYHAKLFRNLKKESYRLHLFNEENYLGYITLRPTIYYTKIGKSYISPKATLNSTAYIVTSEFEVNILGNKSKVRAYPWMYQETDISVCAHVAAWSIIRYYGNEYSIYSDKKMMDIVNYTPNGTERNIPSKGLVITQIADILRKDGFNPIIAQKRNDDSGNFIDEVYAYIESGIPMVAAITKYGHAVTIVGHGKPNYSNLDTCKKKFNISSKLIECLIINDDNHLPYLEVTKKVSGRIKAQKYDLEDIDYVIVPVYTGIMLGYWSVRRRVEDLINSNSYDFNEKNIVRIYLTPSTKLKYKMNDDNSIEVNYKTIITTCILPEYVWCVDISTPEEYKNGLMSCKIIIDSTAGTFEENPWIIIQDKKKVVYKDVDKYYAQQVQVSAYAIYRTNLEEVW